VGRPAAGGGGRRRLEYEFAETGKPKGMLGLLLLVTEKHFLNSSHHEYDHQFSYSSRPLGGAIVFVVVVGGIALFPNSPPPHSTSSFSAHRQVNGLQHVASTMGIRGCVRHFLWIYKQHAARMAHKRTTIKKDEKTNLYSVVHLVRNRTCTESIPTSHDEERCFGSTSQKWTKEVTKNNNCAARQ
jgi:hypothetical protein